MNFRSRVKAGGLLSGLMSLTALDSERIDVTMLRYAMVPTEPPDETI